MVINNRQKPYKIINKVSDLVDLIINDKTYKIFKDFKSEYKEKIQQKINKTEYLNYKQIRPFLNEFMGPESNRSIDFWLCRGFTEEESINIIRDLQIKSAKNIDQSKIINTKNVRYWQNKGYTLEESKKIISKSQSTFSLKKCIEKYGQEEGLRIFNQRQEKWINSIIKKKLNDLGFNHDNINFDSNERSYTDNWMEQMVYANYPDIEKRKTILYILNNINTFEELGLYISNIIKTRILEIVYIYNNVLILDKFNVTSNEIRKKINRYLTFDWHENGTNQYGKKVKHNEFIFDSQEEYLIGKFLIDNQINFKHNRKYPNSEKKYRYDFYLPDKNLYIELFGLKNIKIKNELIENYVAKSEKKIQFCIDNNFELLHGVKSSEIINKLKEIYGITNKSRKIRNR